MLPTAGNASIIRFSPSSGQSHLILDPTVYGNGGVIDLPNGSRLIFDGDGTVELKNGVMFRMMGTYGDPNQSDWPSLITQNLTIMTLDQNATVSVVGVGNFIIRSNGTLRVDKPESKLTFGGNFATDEIIFDADFDSNITIDDPIARISFYNGIFDIIFDNHSTMHILQGILELNMLYGMLPGGSSGYIRKWHVINGAELDIQKNGTAGAVLSIAPNRNDQPVDFDSHSGFICAGGDFEYKCFDASGTGLLVDTVCQIQSRNSTIATDSLSEIFRQLCYVLNPQIVKSPDATILCIMGSKLNPSRDGSLGAFLPKQGFPNGSAVYLQQGDHDICYDKSNLNGPLDLIRGADRLGVWFTIAHGNEATRFYRDLI